MSRNNSQMVHQPRGQMASVDDVDGNGSADYVTYTVPKTIKARLINPDAPNAASESLLGLWDATRQHPVRSFRELAGWGCLWVVVICFGLAIVRKGEPEPVNTSGLIHYLSPNVIGTNLGYWAKDGIRNAATSAHNSTIANTDNAKQQPSESLVNRKPKVVFLEN